MASIHSEVTPTWPPYVSLSHLKIAYNCLEGICRDISCVGYTMLVAAASTSCSSYVTGHHAMCSKGIKARADKNLHAF